MKIVGSDLVEWASRRMCQERLPELIRRLIHGTIPRSAIGEIDFPAGEGVQKHGFDGWLSVSEGHGFVPTGFSAWEIGCEADAKKKANNDYADRVAMPAVGFDPKQTTFVFVTPRRWNHKKWLVEKRKEGHWADVRVLDADSLEQWLDLAPAARAWLGPFLGKSPDAQELEDWWQEWSLQTDPPTSPELVRGGRDEDTQALYAWLTDKPSVLSAEVADLSEAAAFLFAAIRLRVRDEALAILDRAVLARDAETVRRLSLDGRGLVIAALDCPIEVARLAAKRGHHVLRATLSVSGGQHIVLGKMSLGLMAAALERMGLPVEAARKFARESGGSLPRVRHWLGEPERYDPSLAPWLLVAKLVESNEQDLETVAKVIGRSVGEVREDLRRFASGPRAVFVREGHVLRWASYEPAWAGLAKHLLKSDLDRFGNVVVEVFEGTAADRHSLVLREGLVQAIAWAGSYVETFANGVDAKSAVRRIVSHLLGLLNHIEAWDRLAAALPLLAEAAPDEWLYAMGQRVEDSPDLVREILARGARFSMGAIAHVELLRALEVLAWSPEHLSDAAAILARLVELDPGSRWHPRPAQSLRHVFAPGYPQTCASLGKRMEALSRIARKYPEVALRLILGFGSSTSVFSTQRPTLRDWAEAWSEGVTHEELHETLEQYQAIAIQIAVREPARWGEVVRMAGWFSERHQAEILEKLATSDLASLDEGSRDEVRGAIRTVLSEAQRTDDRPTFPNPDQVDLLSAILDRLATTDLQERHRWLFAGTVRLPDVSIDLHESHNDVLIKRRIAAAGELMGALSNEEMLVFAESVGAPGPLGFALVESPADRSRVYQLIGLTLASTGESLRMFRNGMLWALHKADPEGLLRSIRAPAPEVFGALSEVQRAELLAPLRASRAVWEIVDTLGEEARLTYWRRMEPVVAPVEETAHVITHLIEVGRPIKALDVAHLRMKEAGPYPPGLLVSLLRAVGHAEANEPDVMFGPRWVYVKPLLEQLKAAGNAWDKQVYALERLVLSKVSLDYSAKFLIEELERHPEAFVSLVCELYLEDDAKPGSVNEATAHGARETWRILSDWKRVPGQSESGFEVDEAVLSDWVIRVREGLRERKRRIGGEGALGEVLAHAPPGKDRHWPHEAVRDLLEKLNDTERIEEGLIRGRRNARGWVSRSPDMGGAQERARAERYEAGAAELRRRWPKTARCLELLAKGYRAWAAQQDQEADGLRASLWLGVSPADRVRVFVEELQSRGQYTFTLEELATATETDWGQASVGADMLVLDRRLVSPEPNHFQIVPFGTHGAIAKAPSPTAAPIDGDAS